MRSVYEWIYKFKNKNLEKIGIAHPQEAIDVIF